MQDNQGVPAAPSGCQPSASAASASSRGGIPNAEGFVPCPLCKQYSHSIGEGQLAEAFRHFHTMYAHPIRGHPMGGIFDEKTRDAAQILMAAASSTSQFRCAPVAVENDGWSEWLHPEPGFLSQCCDCGLIHEMAVAIGGSDGPPCNDGETEGRVVLFRMRRADAQAIEARRVETAKQGSIGDESAVTK